MSEQLIDSSIKLLSILGSKELGIHRIKLRALLELGQELGLTSKYISHLPPVGLGSITLVDQVVIIFLLKLVLPQKVLEIGTFKGYTTRLILDNTEEGCLVCSVDLPNSSIDSIGPVDEEHARQSAEENDNYLRFIQSKEGRPHLVGISEAQQQRLFLVAKDSSKIDFKTEFSECNMVFIDGGHDFALVDSDSKNSFEVVKRGVIIWHDYGSTIHGDVTKYLDSRSSNLQIFYVENSLIAFSFVNIDFK
jgi:SAM-dependent methyltransferase